MGFSFILKLSFSLIFLISHVRAETKTLSLEGKKLGSFNIRVLGSAKYQNGNFASEDKSTVIPRHLNGFGAEALAGVVFGPVIIGGGGEYMTWFQASEPKDSSDFSGASTNLFASAGLAIHRFLFLGKYIFNYNYQLEKKDINGDKTKYFGPEGSYALLMVYRIGKRSFINIEWDSLTLGKKKSGSTTTSLEKNEKIDFTSVGLSYGMIF